MNNFTMQARTLFLSLQCPSCKAQLRSNPGWFRRNTECRYCNADLRRLIDSHAPRAVLHASGSALTAA